MTAASCHLVILSPCHPVTLSGPSPPAGRHQREAHDPILHQLGLVGAVGELRVERADDQPIRVNALSGQELLYTECARLGERPNAFLRKTALRPWPGRAAFDLQV